MPYSLNSVAVPDAYSDACTLSCPNSRTVTVQIPANGSVFCQIAIGNRGVASFIGGEQWDPEFILLPGYWTMGETDFRGGVCHAIRFRNVVAGTVNTVTAIGSG